MLNHKPVDTWSLQVPNTTFESEIPLVYETQGKFEIKCTFCNYDSIADWKDYTL